MRNRKISRITILSYFKRQVQKNLSVLIKLHEIILYNWCNAIPCHVYDWDFFTCGAHALYRNTWLSNLRAIMVLCIRYAI